MSCTFEHSFAFTRDGFAIDVYIMLQNYWRSNSFFKVFLILEMIFYVKIH